MPISAVQRRSGRIRFRILLAVSVTLTVVACGGAVAAVVLRSPHSTGPRDRGALPGTGEPASRASAVDQSGPSPSGPTCAYLPADPGPAASRVIPAPPARPALTGTVQATIQTSLGDIRLLLNADAAPCTVNAFATLALGDFYSDTPCHRLTTDALWLLQCGDPSGTGMGTPGFRYADENLPTTAHPAYPRGTLAMGNAAPDTNGSQFFIVYRDSEIEPNYPVFGEVTSGMEIVDEVAAAGTDSGGPDGRPRQEITVNEITIG